MVITVGRILTSVHQEQELHSTDHILEEKFHLLIPQVYAILGRRSMFPPLWRKCIPSFSVNGKMNPLHRRQIILHLLKVSKTNGKQQASETAT